MVQEKAEYMNWRKQLPGQGWEKVGPQACGDQKRGTEPLQTVEVSH